MYISDLELLYHLIHGHDLLLCLRIPPKEREEIQKGFSEVSFPEVFAYSDISSALRELLSIGSEDIRKVCVLGESDTKSSSDEYLLRYRADPLFTAHDVGDLHRFIIEYDRTMIGRIESI